MNKLSRLSNGCGKLVTSLPVLVNFCQANCPLVFIKAISAVERKGHANQEGDSHTEVTGMPTPLKGRPMWVWLKLKLAPKGDFCAVSVTTCIFLYINFFMHSPKRYLSEWTNIVTFRPINPKQDRNLQFTPLVN